jgi:hypothetical protein
MVHPTCLPPSRPDSVEPGVGKGFRIAMPRLGFCSVWVVAAAAFSASLAGAADIAPPASPPNNPIVAPKPEEPAVPTTRRTRVISSDVAAQMSAAVPKYVPPEPQPAPTPTDEQPDLREIDKPRNGIIRLPKFVVTEKPPPVLKEYVVSTKKGLAEIAMRKYLSETYRALNAFSLPLFGASAEERALQMYAEDQRLSNMSEVNDDVRMISATDKAAGAYVKREADKTFVRPGAFDWHPIGR